MFILIIMLLKQHNSHLGFICDAIFLSWGLAPNIETTRRWSERRVHCMCWPYAL